MLPPKALLDALTTHASRLFNGDVPLPRGEFEAQFKVLLQSAFSKLDLVSRNSTARWSCWRALALAWKR
jgi:BMFP domain-containing protein YqiC